MAAVSSSADLDGFCAGKGILGSMKRLRGMQTPDAIVLSRLLNAELLTSCKASLSVYLRCWSILLIVGQQECSLTNKQAESE